MSNARESAALWVGCRLHWACTQGFGQLLAEDDLNPLARSGRRLARRRWRRGHGIPPGMATAILLVRLQRSNTNMVACLERSPEIAARCAELTGRLQAVRRSQAASSPIR